MRRARFLFTLLLLATLCATLAPAANAGFVYDPTDYTYATWARSDLPVSEGMESRTWMWGPAPLDGGLIEPYREGPDGERFVQYYDKARMEITDPYFGDPSSVWYVTNGLLVVELMTGQVQVGDTEFETRDPAWINVAGDQDDFFAPTYATMFDLIVEPALPVSDIITHYLEVDGSIIEAPEYVGYNVVAAHHDPVTDHTVASPFWEFMNSTGIIYADGGYTSGTLFPDPLFGTGRPLTEAYWATIKVAGTYTDVLLQCFERRCLTYTPANEPAWRVEAGNVGAHYKQWRYEDSSPASLPEPGELIYGSDLTDWPTGIYEDGLTYVDDGVYGMHTFEDSALIRYLDTGNTLLTDFWVDLEVRLVSEPDPDSYACLMARADPLALEYSYDLCLGADGMTAAFYDQYNPDYFETLLPWERRTIPAHPNDWVLLSIVVQGENIWYLLDDQVVGLATFSGPGSGTVGFYVSNPGSTPVEFEFRDLYVWALE